MNVTVQDVMRRVRHYFSVRVIRREWLTEGGTLFPRELIAPGSWIAIDGSSPCPGGKTCGSGSCGSTRSGGSSCPQSSSSGSGACQGW